MSKNSDIVTIGNNSFYTLVAVTDEEHQKGLMYQAWPPPIMSFPYKNANIRKFWMKNTESPLDIVFCCAGKVVDIQQGKPYDTTLIGPNKPIDLVVELPQGYVKSHKISVGDSVEIKYSLRTLARKILA